MVLRALNVVGVVAVVGLLATASCLSSIDGTFQVTGAQSWPIAPTTCKRVTLGDGTFTLDLFRYDVTDDTELVVTSDGVLVRVPDHHALVRLGKADCATLDIDEGDYTSSFTHAAVGHVTLDCTQAQLGHIVGTATFTCYK